MKAIFAICSLLYALDASAIECGNPVTTPYNNAPKYFAPDGTRGEGIKIWIKGALSEIVDTKPACLPIPLRYNNFGALKTPSKGPWPGQVGKDDKGHAIFSTVQAGMTAWGIWMKRKGDSDKPQTAMSIMSVYAPPDDCVGSIGKFPNCPFGKNPTAEYAAQVAASVDKTAQDVLSLNGADCKEGRIVLYGLLQQIATFEIGANFCGRESGKTSGLCHIDRELFDKAMDAAFAQNDSENGRCRASGISH